MRRATLVLVFVVAACSGSEGTLQEGSGSVEALDLAGRWLGPCAAAGDGTYFVLDFDLSAADWSVDYVVHGDEACSSPLLTVAIEGPYALTGASEAVSGAWEGTFSFSSKQMTPHVADLAAALDGAGCGSAPWTIGSAQDVYEAGCPAFGQYPEASCSADYDIVSRTGETLQFGARPADNDMCSEDKRPQALSPLELALQ